MSAIVAPKHQRPGRILSHSERKGFQKEIQREKDLLDGRLDAGAGDALGRMPERRRLYLESQTTWQTENLDTMAVHARINRRARLLANGSPDSISSRERAAIEKRAKDHEEFFRQNMLSQSQRNLPYNHPDFNKAVQVMVKEDSPEFRKRATDWKNIQRQLSPEDPSASNLERIRPQ